VDVENEEERREAGREGSLGEYQNGLGAVQRGGSVSMVKKKKGLLKNLITYFQLPSFRTLTKS
jgi:hypothetical protein